MTSDQLPDWVTWQSRPFPDANLLLLPGREPAMVDSGFVGHAEDTAAWARAHAGRIALVVNTHWHSDHVGGNSLLQARGAAVAAAAPDADALTRRDPGCCLAEYLDQPVAPYTVDQPLHAAQVLRLGEADWQVVATPGHTPGHLCLWEPEECLLAVGDALSDLRPRALLTAHGRCPPIPAPGSTPRYAEPNGSSTTPPARSGTAPGASWRSP